jgi:hypothetical protein
MYSGRIFASNRHLILTTVVIKRAIGIPLGKVERDLEEGLERRPRRIENEIS